MRAHILEVHGADSTELFKALASETRVRILELLAQGERNINELGQALGISQPAVTKHTHMCFTSEASSTLMRHTHPAMIFR